MITSLAFSLLVLLFTSGLVVAESKNLTFGLVSGTSAFFEPTYHGWYDKCEQLGVNCLYLIPDWEAFDREKYNHPCEQEFDELIKLKVDGIAATCSYNAVDVFQKAADAGIPVVTFDTSPPDTIPHDAYVGTDQRFLGRTLGRLLRQLRPEGGTFAIINNEEDDAQNLRVEGFMEEIMKDNDRDDRAHWHAVERNFIYESKEPMEPMELYALLNPTAMITMYQTPMRHPNWTDFVDVNRHRNITYVGTDGSDYQLSYLSRRYVDGLVGQLPYDFGAKSAEVLYELATGGTLEKKVFSTNLVAYNLIPLELPTLDVDQNLLGNLKYVGFTCFGLVALAVLFCLAWTLHHRNSVVVSASQPFFLWMTAGGVLLMSSALVPLSFDDEGDPDSMTTTRSIGICMSIPWLAFTGFTVTFSALFSKTWRVNQFFHSSSAFGRIKVSEKDVLAPFAFLLTSNFIVLICWTVIDPLTYERQFEDGTDYWNREIASIGSCHSDHVAAYLAPLGLSKFPKLLSAHVPFIVLVLLYSPTRFPKTCYLLRTQSISVCLSLLVIKPFRQEVSNLNSPKRHTLALPCFLCPRHS
jgi:gamma-aminobutyric acid type B receptor